MEHYKPADAAAVTVELSLVLVIVQPEASGDKAEVPSGYLHTGQKCAPPNTAPQWSQSACTEQMVLQAKHST